MVKDITNAIKDGEDLTQSDVFRFLDQIVNEYNQYLTANGLDRDLWGDRAVDYAYERYTKVVQKYTLPEGLFPDENEPDIPPEEDIPPEPEQDGKLFGKDILTSENKAFVRSRGKPRKRILLTLEELERYVNRVPYVLAIQILKDSSGKVIGYRVWVEAAKDKKKRPKSAS